MPCGLTGTNANGAQSERGSYVEISLENNACRFGPVSRYGVRFCANVRRVVQWACMVRCSKAT